MTTLRTAATPDRMLVGDLRTPTRALRRWANLPGYAAAVWSSGYAALALWLAVGEPDRPAGWLPGSGLAQPGILVLIGVLGAAVALATNRRQGHGIPRLALLAFAWTAAALLLVLPDRTAVAEVAVGLLLHTTTVDWPTARDALCFAGGMSWALVALAYQSYTGGGRSPSSGTVGR